VQKAQNADPLSLIQANPRKIDSQTSCFMLQGYHRDWKVRRIDQMNQILSKVEANVNLVLRLSRPGAALPAQPVNGSCG